MLFRSLERFEEMKDKAEQESANSYHSAWANTLAAVAALGMAAGLGTAAASAMAAGSATAAASDETGPDKTGADTAVLIALMPFGAKDRAILMSRIVICLILCKGMS